MRASTGSEWQGAGARRHLPSALPHRAALAAVIACVVTSSDVLASRRSAGELIGTLVDAAFSEVLPGANVTIHRPGEGVLMKSGTDARGHYEFSGVPAGTYDVDFSLSGFQTDRHYGVRVVGGTTTLNGSVELGVSCECITIPEPPPGSVVSGRLVDAAGRPVAHAGLILETNDRTVLPVGTAPQVYSGIDGEFAIEVPHDAHWALSIVADDFEAARVDLTPLPYDGKRIVTLVPKAFFPRQSTEHRTLKNGTCCYRPFAHDGG